MKNEVKIWMNFAGENLKSSEILLESSSHKFTHKILFGKCLAGFRS